MFTRCGITRGSKSVNIFFQHCTCLHVTHLSHILGAHVLWHLLILMNLCSSISQEVKYKNIQIECGVCMLAILMFSLLEVSAHY